MNNQLLIYIAAILFLSSCVSLGPIIPHNKKLHESTTDSTSVIRKRLDYFCIGYNSDFSCEKELLVVTDLRTGIVLEKSISKGTNLRMRDGRKKIKTRTLQYDSTGHIKKRIERHYQSYGKYARIRKLKEIEYLSNGQKRIFLSKGTLRNPNKLEKVRYRGNKFKRRDD